MKAGPLAAASVLALLGALAAGMSAGRGVGLCEETTRTEQVHQADVVFSGRVTGVDVYNQRLAAAAGRQLELPRWLPSWLPVPGDSREARTEIRFHADTLYKGTLPSEVTIRWSGRRVPFRTGERYTVFVNRDSGQLWTTECSGNMPGAIEPALYGLSSKPLGQSTADVPALRWALVGVAGLVLGLSLLVLGLSWRGRPGRAAAGAGS